MTPDRVVVLSMGEADRLIETAAAMGLHLTDAPFAGRTVPRPTVVVDGTEIAACLLAGTVDGQLLEVRMIAGPGGLVAVVPDLMLSRVRRIAETASDPMSAFVEVLVLLATSWEEAQEELAEGATELSGALGGLRSAEPRRQIAQLRTQLLASRHRLAVQARFLHPDGELLDVLPAAVRRRADRARTTFLAASSTAEQTYQMLGDLLTMQATTISERLTLISVLFLPLTVTTGFFGMNFGWLVDVITGPTAFWLGGVAAPAAIVVAVLVLFRRMGVAEEPSRPGR